ncbi:MAG: hypothetical protein LBC19_13125 [Tannerella sp.]|jgi:hypothetical protein|nr:hypothetical protein [Tannerella sp.]
MKFYDTPSDTPKPNRAGELDELLMRVDELITDCDAIIKTHQKARELFENCGADKADKKSEAAAKIRSNKNERDKFEVESKALKVFIDDYEKKDNNRNSGSQELYSLSSTIKSRQNSGEQYIPFYGIKYVSDTNRMVENYNQLLRNWNQLNNWLNNTRLEYHGKKSQYLNLLSKIELIRMENDALQKVGASLGELITLINNIIVAFQEFRNEMSTVKNDLHWNDATNCQQFEILIVVSTDKIASLDRIFINRLSACASELPAGLFKQVQTLLA